MFAVKKATSNFQHAARARADDINDRLCLDKATTYQAKLQ
jgi:hypothetical protein